MFPLLDLCRTIACRRVQKEPASPATGREGAGEGEGEEQAPSVECRMQVIHSINNQCAISYSD